MPARRHIANFVVMAKSKSSLGDVRLVQPFTELVNAMSEKMTPVLRRLGEGRKEEVSFGRLINNPKVTPVGLVKQYWLNNEVDWSGKHLLVIEDGSKMSFELRKDRPKLGYMGESEKIGGFAVHNAVIYDAQDLSCYGLGAAEAFVTERLDAEEKRLRRKDQWKTPFEEKDRYKWFSTAKQAIENCSGASAYTVVGDRESDIYDLFARLKKQGWGFVIRCCAMGRKVCSTEGSSTLCEVIDSWEVAHSYDLELSATRKRSKHTGRMHLKFGQVELLHPSSHPDKSLPEKISVSAIQVKEDTGTVPSGEEPVHWLLLTSHEVQSIEQAIQIVQWYCERWNIEQTYRTIKLQGLDVEHSEVHNQHALQNLSVLCLIAATVVMQLVRARTEQSKLSMECAFTPQEIECIEKLNPTLQGNTLKQKNPYTKGSMAFAAWVIARLGGWSGYARGRPPGPITMTNGLVRFYAIAVGFNLRL